MAQFPLRINLAAQGFPFLSELHGRTVVVPQLDETQNKHSSVTQEYGDNVAEPAVYYCHNVMPTAQGFQSVGYNMLSLAPADTDSTFLTVLTLRDSDGNKAYLGITTSGRNYILRTYLSGWVRTTDVAPAEAGGLVTTAYVNGITYIYYAKTGCYTYDFATNTLNAQTLTALSPGSIVGITAANGYLLAFGLTTAYWSSNISATDFTPSLITGAGGGAIQDLKGVVLTVLPHKLGFMIYSDYNIVVGIYTANIRYPFTLKEIVGSGGIPGNRFVDKDPLTGDHYAYTTSGFQLVTAQNTNTAFPELTDFLAGAAFEDFDELTGIFTETALAVPMQKRLTSVADRYVVLSYGISSLTHAIVYDTALRRMGKLKIAHVDCFEYLLLNTNSVDTPRNSIGFLQADGTVRVASFVTTDVYAQGCIILGKFQLVRANTCDLLSAHIENVRPDATFSCADRPTRDGKNVVATVPGYLAQNTGLFREYTFRSSGLNHSILCTGAFNLVSVVLYFGQAGCR